MIQHSSYEPYPSYICAHIWHKNHASPGIHSSDDTPHVTIPTTSHARHTLYIWAVAWVIQPDNHTRYKLLFITWDIFMWSTCDQHQHSVTQYDENHWCNTTRNTSHESYMCETAHIQCNTTHMWKTYHTHYINDTSITTRMYVSTTICLMWQSSWYCVVQQTHFHYTSLIICSWQSNHVYPK